MSVLADRSDLLTLRGLPVPSYPEPPSAIRELLFWPWEATKAAVGLIVSPGGTLAASDLFPWLMPVERRLETLRALAPNWDTYGGERISSTQIVEALRFLIEHMQPDAEPPWVVPLGSGGIQLEWHKLYAAMGGSPW